MITTRVHWLTFTVFGLEPGSFKTFWNDNLGHKLGELTLMSGGVRRGFQATYQALAGAKVYTDPLQVSPKGDYFCVELPGDACDCLTPDDFYNLSQLRVQFSGFGDGQLRVSRLDLAVDNAPFSPKMVYEHYKAGLIRTWARRSSISIRESPEEKCDNGTLGTFTLYVGKGESQRMLRIYNQRGFTRVELQCRDAWSDIVFSKVCELPYAGWMPVVLGAIDKFFSVLSSWWYDFVAARQEVSVVVSSARVVTVNKMQRWIINQVSPTLEVLSRIMEPLEYQAMLKKGVTEDRLLKYGSVLQLGA